MTNRSDPVAPADDAARALARDILNTARFAALAVIDPTDCCPGISRIAFGLSAGRGLLTLISALAPHHAALQQNPDCALMVGEVGEKGDPLTHPRLMIKARAAFISVDDPDRATLRADWLHRNPKAKLYIDFADFSFVRFTPVSALLNGGFARAYRLAPTDFL